MRLRDLDFIAPKAYLYNDIGWQIGERGVIADKTRLPSTMARVRSRMISHAG